MIFSYKITAHLFESRPRDLQSAARVLHSLKGKDGRLIISFENGMRGTFRINYNSKIEDLRGCLLLVAEKTELCLSMLNKSEPFVADYGDLGVVELPPSCSK